MNGTKSLAGPLAISALALHLALALGCSGTEDPSNTGGSSVGARGGDAGSGNGGGGGSAGSGGTAGAGGTAQAGAAGEGGAGGEPDGGAGGSGGSGGSSVQAGFTYPEGCPTPTPEPAPGQVIVIQSVNFINSEVVLRNVSNEDQVIIAGRQGWQWCSFPAYWNIVLSEDAADNVTLSPGETYAFIPINNLMGPLPLYRDGGEMAIYTNTGAFTTASQMRAFVSWGDHVGEREPTAVVAGYWTNSDRIAVAISAAGFMATGNTSRASGYRAVREECLVHPPNE